MIPWESIKYFSPTEFTDNVNLAEPKLLLALDKFRKILKNPIHPSPVKGSLARVDEEAKYSRHYAKNRLSDAVDVFCDAHPALVWHKAITCRLWGGVGIYFDTQFEGESRYMFHLDMRPNISNEPVIWARQDGAYTKPMARITDLKQIMRHLC